MPHFDQYGGDEWICQVCGRVQSSRVGFGWRPDITNNTSAGNVCPTCLKRYTERQAATPISLAEHCRRESGGLTGTALNRYINRYYGFG
jgi:hypothetical protein